LESIIGTDDRVRILDTELAPWRMVCALQMRGPTGSAAIGTGWFVGPKTIVTAGHCVFSNHFFDGWASTIGVSPGRNGSEFPFGTVESAKFTSVDRWVQSEDPDFDIGCIHLSDPLGDRVGWFGVGALSPPELEGYLVNVSGYPGDRGMGTEQYHHKNRVLRVTERRVFYDVDTFGGQSGAPVWIHETDNSPPIAIGIHAYGVDGASSQLQANSAPRIIPEVLEQIRKWVEADGGWPNTS
jgi:V8-like Glu-specific endopeptidase